MTITETRPGLHLSGAGPDLCEIEIWHEPDSPDIRDARSAAKPCHEPAAATIDAVCQCRHPAGCRACKEHAADELPPGNQMICTLCAAGGHECSLIVVTTWDNP